MTKKRLPSSPTGASPEAKKQDSRASPPSQRVQEQVDGHYTSKVTIKSCNTAGGGNCFFHAVFGDNSSGSYKTKNADAMRQEWHKFLSQFNSLQDPTMPNQLKDQLKKVFQFFLNKPQDLTNRAEQIKELVNQTKKIISKAEADVHQLKNDIVNKFPQDTEFQNKIYKIIQDARDIKNEQPLTLQELLNDQDKLLNEINVNLKDCALQFNPNLTEEQYNTTYNTQTIADLFLENPEVYKNYLDAIKSNSYYIFFEEVPIIASLVNVKVIIHYNLNGNQKMEIEPNQKLINSGYSLNKKFWGTKEKAIIFHEGMHFSHAEYYTSDIQNQHYAPIRGYSNANEEAIQKFHVKELSSKIFGIEISDNKYANITINDKDGNHHITVCRPQIIGESVEQMHNVTSYMFIRKALKKQIKDVLDGKAYILNNFIDYILAISKQIQGICLTQDEYKKILLSKGGEEFFDLSIITKKDNSDITRYLITNKSIIDELHKYGITKSSLLVYNKNYVTQLQRYIKYVFNNLKQMMLDSLDTCELTAKFVASIFDPEGYLVEKNNVLFKKILLYRCVWQARDAYDKYAKTLPNKDTFQGISNTEHEKIIGETKGPYIRIIDDKKAIVERSVQALDIIEQLINHSLCQNNNDKTNNLLSEYNDNYNHDIRELIYGYDESESDDESEPDFTLKDYNENLSQDNLYKIFHYHAAKALYFICDFQSLGRDNRILAQEEGEETEVVRIHPSVTGKEIEQYYIIEKPDIQLEKLTTQAIAHISILLSPFASLRSHASLTNDEEQLSPIQKIFRAFCELLKEDYNLPDILIQEQFDAKIINSLNEAGLLGNNDVQYDLDF